MTRHGPGNYCRRGVWGSSLLRPESASRACDQCEPFRNRVGSCDHPSHAADVSGLLLVRYEARLRSLERQVADLKDEVRRLRG